MALCTRLTRPQEGRGQGLGDLTVESTPGVGSTLSLRLPPA